MATVHSLIVEIYDDVRQRTCPGSSVGGRRKSQRLPRDGVSLLSAKCSAVAHPSTNSLPDLCRTPYPIESAALSFPTRVFPTTLRIVEGNCVSFICQGDFGYFLFNEDVRMHKY